MSESPNMLQKSLATGPLAEAIEGLPRSMIGRTLDFCRLLKSAGLNVTSGRIVDVFRALRYVELGAREDFRLALRTNLAASQEEEELFDRLFREFWENASRTAQRPVELKFDEVPEEQNQRHLETPPDTRGEPAQYSGDEVLRRKDLAAEWPGDLGEMNSIVRELTRRLATRPSRRRVAANRGRRIDLRRSLRKNIRYGMDVLELARSRRKIRKVRLALLCDVSGSMDSYSPFLLRVMFGLQKGFRNSRTAVFSTRMTEITRALRRQSIQETLAEVEQTAQHWSGGTDIGGALANFNRSLLREGSATSTITIIVSDGYDQGDPAVVRREMQALRRRSRAIVWINPLLGTEGYQPIAQGLRAALPYVDYFLPANDLQSLRELCRTLGSV
jgi:uncharacterized protein with von Willebrand factor type A (vWA) domain